MDVKGAPTRASDAGRILPGAHKRGWQLAGSLVRLMRPVQWIKNLLVFAPAFFAGQITEIAVLGRAGVAFVAVTLVAASIYSLNDVFDQEIDRLHPRKYSRPVAANEVSPRIAVVLSGILVIAGFGVSLSLGNPAVVGWLLAYYLTNLLYALWAKHVAIVDIFLLDFGYLARLLIGGAAAGIALSQWILLVTAFAAGSLAVGKRRQERIRFDAHSSEGRKVIAAYPLGWLDHLLAISTGAAIVFYSLWAFEAAGALGSSLLPWTVAPVSYGFIRYSYLARTTEISETPERILFADRPIAIALLIWGLTIFLALHVF